MKNLTIIRIMDQRALVVIRC